MAKYALNDRFSQGVRSGVDKGLTSVGRGIYGAFPKAKGTLDKIADFANKPMSPATALGLKRKTKKGKKMKMAYKKKMKSKKAMKPGDLFNAMKKKNA